MFLTVKVSDNMFHFVKAFLFLDGNIDVHTGSAYSVDNPRMCLTFYNLALLQCVFLYFEFLLSGEVCYTHKHF